MDPVTNDPASPSIEWPSAPTPQGTKDRLKSRAGCDFCRSHHLKCGFPLDFQSINQSVGDSGIPRCSRCEQSGIECQRDIKFRFRHETRHSEASHTIGQKREFIFPSDQKWTSIPNHLTFIIGNLDDQGLDVGTIREFDEAKDVSRDYVLDGSSRVTYVSPVSFASTVIDAGCQKIHLEAGHLSTQALDSVTRREDRWSDTDSGQWPTFDSIERQSSAAQPSVCLIPTASEVSRQRLESQQLVLHGESPPDSARLSSDRQGQDLASPSSASVCLPFEVQNESEARLFRHFVDNLSSWFDLTDPTCSFRREVHERVQSSHTLERAIYAIASRHLACLGMFDRFEADRYSEKCLESFIGLLNNASAATDDSLLAATVILRVTEELQVPWTGSDPKTHIVGTKAFIRCSESISRSSNFRKAAFWTGLRQEINLALLDHSQIQTPLDLDFIDVSLGIGDEGTWANRIIVNLAKIINFCFGEGSKSISEYRILKQYGTEWAELRPSRLKPFYTTRAHSLRESFPQIWYSSDAAVMAAQYHNIARLLLASFNPDIPRVGPSRLSAVQQTAFEIRDIVKELCGVGLSNPRTVPAMLVACQGIALCGDYFEEPQERQALLEVLRKTNAETAWPTNATEEHLQASWNGRTERA